MVKLSIHYFMDKDTVHIACANINSIGLKHYYKKSELPAKVVEYMSKSKVGSASGRKVITYFYNGVIL